MGPAEKVHRFDDEQRSSNNTVGVTGPTGPGDEINDRDSWKPPECSCRPTL
jgi:hypothetical protein